MAVKINTGGESGNGGNTIKRIIIGADLALVAIIAFYTWNNFNSDGHKPVTVIEHVQQ